MAPEPAKRLPGPVPPSPTDGGGGGIWFIFPAGHRDSAMALRAELVLSVVVLGWLQPTGEGVGV